MLMPKHHLSSDGIDGPLFRNAPERAKRHAEDLDQIRHECRSSCFFALNEFFLFDYHRSVKTVLLTEAQSGLDQLFDEAQAGSPVLLVRGDQVVKLERVEPPQF